jgi:hypothetical protein
MFYVIESEKSEGRERRMFLSIQGSDLCMTDELSNATWFPTKVLADAVVDGYELDGYVVVDSDQRRIQDLMED